MSTNLVIDQHAPAIVHCHQSEKMHYVLEAKNFAALCMKDVTGMTMIPHHNFGRPTEEYEWCERCLERLEQHECPEIEADRRSEAKKARNAEYKRAARPMNGSKWYPGRPGRKPRWVIEMEKAMGISPKTRKRKKAADSGAVSAEAASSSS